jgi:hypothetical protein
LKAAIHAIAPLEVTAVRTELAAMRSVADTLEHLPDNEARARVLKWVAEFFDVKTAKPGDSLPGAGAPPVQARSADPFLAVTALSSFFGPRPQVDELDGADEFEPLDWLNVEPAAAAPASETGRGVESMVHSFVADFQKLARDWQE